MCFLPFVPLRKFNEIDQVFDFLFFGGFLMIIYVFWDTLPFQIFRQYSGIPPNIPGNPPILL